MTLKELRKSKGLYTSFVAKELKVTTRHLNRIENGEGYMTEERAEKLAELYSVTKSEIMSIYGGEIRE